MRGAKSLPITAVLFGFDFCLPSSSCFEYKGETVSLEQYMKKRYDITLRREDARQPLLLATQAYGGSGCCYHIGRYLEAAGWRFVVDNVPQERARWWEETWKTNRAARETHPGVLLHL
jgi:hypothetical protein